jgi:hypothetical protein
VVVEAAEHAELIEEDLNTVCGTSLRRKPLQHAQLQPAPQPRCEHIAPGVEKGLHINVVLAPAPRLCDTLTHLPTYTVSDNPRRIGVQTT